MVHFFCRKLLVIFICVGTGASGHLTNFVKGWQEKSIDCNHRFVLLFL